MGRYIENRATLDKLTKIQAKLDKLASQADHELSEAVLSASCGCEMAIELVMKRIQHEEERLARLRNLTQTN